MSASGERRNDPGPPEEVCNFGLAGKQNANSATWPVTAGAGLVKARARAFRWKRMLESGDFVTIKELADREGIAVSYLTRVLRLTLLAPDIVEAILDGTQEPDRTLSQLLETLPTDWQSQRRGHYRPGSATDLARS